MTEPFTDRDLRNEVTRHVSEIYTARRASYDIAAIVGAIQATYGTVSIDTIDGDAFWELIERHVTCLHSWEAGMCVVHEEDLDYVAAVREVECGKCERVYAPRGAK